MNARAEQLRRRLRRVRSDLSFWVARHHMQQRRGERQRYLRAAHKMVLKLHNEELALMEELGELPPNVRQMLPGVTHAKEKQGWQHVSGDDTSGDDTRNPKVKGNKTEAKDNGNQRRA